MAFEFDNIVNIGNKFDNIDNIDNLYFKIDNIDNIDIYKFLDRNGIVYEDGSKFWHKTFIHQNIPRFKLVHIWNHAFSQENVFITYLLIYPEIF